MPSRSIRSDEDLRKISTDLYYEVWMLESLARAMASGALGKGPLANAVLEAFTIHVRGVMDFLYSESPRPDDVIAQDFLPSNIDWQRVRVAPTAALKLARERAGKEVAHLTYARLNVTPEAKPWPFLEIAQDVSKAFGVFLQNASKDKLDDKWRDGVPA
jgi:hypothetical protein